MKPPRYAKKLQEAALATVEPKKRTEEQFRTAVLLFTCSKAVHLITELQRLQPSACMAPVNLLEQLAIALQKQVGADSMQASGTPVASMQKRAEKLSSQALIDWYNFAIDLPDWLAKNLESLERQRETKLPAGFTGVAEQAVGKPKAAAKRGVPLKKKKA